MRYFEVTFLGFAWWVKGKVVPGLQLHNMKMCEGLEVKLHTFLTLALYGGELSPSCSNCFIPGERVPITHWIGGWVGPSQSG
jgi:hypothetical protein